MPHDLMVPVRMSEELVSELDRVAEVLSKRAGGVRVSRSEVVRLAVERGIAVLDAEVGAGKKAASARGKGRGR